MGAGGQRMEHFSEEAPTYEEAVEKVRQKYGERAKIYARERRGSRGFLGFGKKETVLVSGYVTEPQARSDEPPSVSPTERGYSQLLQELKGMEQRLSAREHNDRTVQHKNIEHIEKLLDDNDFSRDFIAYVSGMVKSRMPVHEIDNAQRVELFAVRLIAESFQFDTENALSLPRLFGIVGPTGVGKTTTIAKIAARFSMGPTSKRRRKVRIITIDSFRIGAREQIRSYGNLMDIPVDTVESPGELETCLVRHADADLLLIDTIGKSPRDAETLGEMKKILSVCGKEAYWALALSASTKGRDLLYMSDKFEPFGYKSLILTKLDETDRVGNLVSMLHAKKKEIIYVSAGQKVPTDLVIPKTSLFLEKLQGFSVDLEHLTKLD